MRQNATRNLIGNLIVWASVITTMAVTPKTTSDPINPVKMASLSIFSFVIAALLITNADQKFFQKHKKTILVAISFVSVLLINVTTSSQNFLQEFFGVYGRNTGFVTYLSLTLLLVGAAVGSSRKLIEKYLYVLSIVGVISMLYGYLQILGLDPAGWNSPYSPVIGFLGNPNFAAAFQAMALIAATSLFQIKKWKLLAHIAYFAFSLLALLLMALSGDQQGFLVLFIGLAVVGTIKVYFSRFQKLGVLMFGSGAIGFVLLLLALINQGPLARYIYESSLVSRGHYWDAAWRMLLNNPLWGTGLDSFGDWYFRFRSIAAYEWLPFQNTNSAHNVYLDIATGGGLPLIITFLALNLLALKSIYTNLKNANRFDLTFVVLIGCWVGFHAQMFISINQIGLAIWGWTICGLIIGYKSKDADADLEIPSGYKSKTQSAKNIRKEKIQPSSILAIFAGILLGSTVGLPPLLADTKYFTEMSSGDPIRIQNAANIWPSRQQYYLQVSISLRDNKSNTITANPGVDPTTISDYSDLGLSVAREMVKKFPNSFYSWELLRSFPRITPEEDLLSKSRMRELNPIAYSTIK